MGRRLLGEEGCRLGWGVGEVEAAFCVWMEAREGSEERRKAKSFAIVNLINGLVLFEGTIPTLLLSRGWRFEGEVQ
jgi:hypothetical protein